MELSEEDKHDELVKKTKSIQGNQSNEINKKNKYNDITENNNTNDLSIYNIEHIDYLDEIFKNTFNILKINEKYRGKIKNKINLEKSMLDIVYITPDGYCYFRALSQFLFQTESKYNLLRMAIYTYAKQNIDIISNFQDSVEISPNKFISTRHYNIIWVIIKSGQGI